MADGVDLPDPRPMWCAETLGLAGKVVELGPAHGLHTLALERLGATVEAIEGNPEAFSRCEDLKASLGMTSTFRLADFTAEPIKADLLYASGVLYHLLDPVGFLAGLDVERLFLWTHYYDPKAIALIPEEAAAFRDTKPVKRILGKSAFAYWPKVYDPSHVAAPGYTGGLNPTCNWLSKADLMRALDECGFNVVRVVEDNGGLLPALNIFAVRRS